MSGLSFTSVLFLCVANSARSQLAEALARRRFGAAVRVQSAGSAPSRVHPLAIAALAELGINAAAQHSKSVDTIAPAEVDLVITLCAEEECPVFLSSAPRLHWPLPDPARAAGGSDEQEQLAQFRRTRDELTARIDVLAALREVPAGPEPVAFHASIRVPHLGEAARFYSWLLGVNPKEWTHRYVTFIHQPMRLNFVVLVDDGLPLHHDTLYHLGVDVGSKSAVIAAHRGAQVAGWTIHKPARTTWRGTPLHELWLKDPGGNLVEVYARLTDAELDARPDDLEPVLLTLPESDAP
jgi:protein-tyrosine-phosphatase/catechol 2,3-dioxygenase-like lactoylglutathione lyase family enzyme